MSSRLAGLASSAPALVLERSLGARAGVDSELWKTLPFAAEVIPDLPVASSWPGLLQAVTARCISGNVSLWTYPRLTSCLRRPLAVLLLQVSGTIITSHSLSLQV